VIAVILFGLFSDLPLKTCVVSLDIMWKRSLLFVILLPLLHFVTGGLVRRCSTNGEFLLKSGLCEYNTGEYLLHKMKNNSDRVGHLHETFLAA
jgi:hypothetical protein